MIGTKKAWALSFLMLLPLNLQAKRIAQNDSFSVIPGRRIGRVRLNEKLDSLEQRLGPSSYGDSAAGHHWRTWRAYRPDRATGIRCDLDIYAEVDGIGGPYVRLIRVASRQFHTANGIACGSALAQIQKCYPHARRVARYLPLKAGGPVIVIDAIAQGIAFEFASDREGKVRSDAPCMALTVHSIGSRSIQDQYYPLTQYEASKQNLATNPSFQNPARRP